MKDGDEILEKDSRALCGICNNTLRQCKCPDIDERLRDIAKSPYVVYRWCNNCDKHYARCNCRHPVWVRSDTREFLVDCNVIQQKMEAAGL